MNKKIISGFLMFALAVFSMSSFVACKDYDEDSYDDLKARLNKEISLREALQNQVNALDAAIKQIKSCNCDPSKYASKDEFDKAMKRIDSIADALSKIKPVEPGKDYDADIKKLYENDSLMVIKMNEINSWIVYVQNLAKQDSIRIDSLSGAISGWGTTITTLYTRVDSLIQALKHGKKDTIYISGGGCDSLCAAKIAKAQYTADSALLIAEKALVLAVHNANRIAALENYVNNLVTKGELANEVQSLNIRLENLLDQMITGIIIQGVSSPVLGYLNTPFDVRSQMLAAFYGNVTNAVKFPATTNTADLVDISMAWTARNIEVMGTPSQVTIPAGRFVSQKNGKEEGNAGTLYLTLNPAEADFEGRTLSLVDSKDNAAAVTLSPLAKADTLLSFGYTRAAANNGLYETQATLTKDNIDAAKLKIDYTTFEEEAKAIVKEKSVSSVLTFGATLLQNMDELLPAYAVKATWTRPGYYSNYDWAPAKDFNVYSQYGIAATAIKPLSFAFLKDFNASLPGEARVQSLFDQIIDKININISLGLPDFSKYQGAITFKDITLPTISDDLLRIQYKYSLTDKLGGKYIVVTNTKGDFALVGPDGKLYHNATTPFSATETKEFGAFSDDLTIDIDINKTADVKKLLEDLINDINKQFGANSDLAKKITELMNDVASLGSIDGKINKAINDAKTDIKNVISSYITAAYKKLNHWISVFPNKALQPTLLAVTGDKKAGILSQSFAMPTKATGSLTLVPTTFTLETLAPAYKKFVAVTNVWKDGAEAPAAKGKAANGTNMLKVIDSEKTCTLNGEAGYLYEVSYSAVDYHGKIVTKRFYVQF